MRFRFILAEKANHDVKLLCRVLEVSRSGFYAWCAREPSRRAQEDVELLDEIQEVFDQSRSTYGSPRVHEALKRTRPGLGRRRVARLMRRAGLRGRPKRRFVVTTDSAHDYEPAPNILDRQFDVDAPNEVWAGDITYVPTDRGWAYLAVVLDLFSRRVVGWSLAPHMRTDLVLDAMRNAVETRRPPAGLLFHSDRGSQYASDEFQQYLDDHAIRSSMSRRGNCWDNAPTESFFRTYKVEGLPHRQAPDHRAATLDAFDYIEGFYNTHRLHSTLGYLSPVEYESTEPATRCVH